MDPTEQKDLFDIRITPSGKLYIRKFAVIARIIILIGLLISFVHIAVSLICFIKIDPDLYADDKIIQLEFRLLPYYIVIYCVFFFPQMYFYWQVTRHLRNGLNYNDETTFNKSFHALFKYAVFGVISIMLSLLSYTFELYWYIKHYLN